MYTEFTCITEWRGITISDSGVIINKTTQQGHRNRYNFHREYDDEPINNIPQT